MWETEKPIEDTAEIWTGFTVQIVNHHLCWLSSQPVYYDWATLCCTAAFALSHVGSWLSNLTLYKDCKSSSPSQQISAPPPLLSSSGLHHPQLSPPLWEYALTHLFDCSIWPGWWEIWRVTKGLAFDATSQQQQKLVTWSSRRLDEGKGHRQSCRVS